MDRQLVIDISVLGRAGGQAVGIVRVARELARWAHARRLATFVFFDHDAEAFRLIQPGYVEAVIEGRAIIDTSRQPDKIRARPPFPQRVPRFLREPALWLHNPRRRVIVALEGMQLRSGKDRPWAEWLLAKLFSDKYRSELTDPSGKRRRLLPFELVAGDKFELDARHLLLCVGSDWSATTIAHVNKRREEAGLKVGFICYDIIPLLYPQYFFRQGAASFHRLFHNVVVSADIVLVTAHQIASDIRDYCQANRLPVPRTAVFKPGADLVLKSHGGAGPVQLPAGLQPGRYAIFVSTIEPRKGHKHLLNIWRKLVAAGVPQAADFKMVFVGRRGWLVDDLMDELETDPNYGKSLVVLSGTSDNVLAELYRNAAFGLYPSLYEGYGLPVVELFGHGKAVVASSGGALKEVVGDFSPSLPPRDEAAWVDALQRWIADPSARIPYETAIRERFSHPTWPQAAEAFFALLDRELQSSSESRRAG